MIKLILWNPYFLGQKLFCYKNVAPQFSSPQFSNFYQNKKKCHLFFTKSQKNDQFLLKMEPKEPSPTHPNRTEHKQEPPTRSRGRPRLTTEQKEKPPKRPRGRLWNPYFLGEFFFVLKTWHLSFF